MPKVSVIIATYNCEDYVVQAVKSALAQTYRDFEIIVVDDGSTDDTAARLKEFTEKIHYLYQANAGPAAAHNLGLAHSMGQYIAFLNHDDLWAPQYLDSQVAYLDNNPKVDLVHTAYYEIDEEGRILREKGGKSLQGYCLSKMFEKNIMSQSMIMLRREPFFKLGLWDIWSDPSDRELYIRLASSGCSFGYISTPLVFYRIRRGSITQRTPWRQLEGQAYAYKKYLAWLKRSDVHIEQCLLNVVQSSLDEVMFKLTRHYRIKSQRRKAFSILLPLVLRRPWRLRYILRFISILVPNKLVDKVSGFMAKQATNG